jgi:hypothetical protein
LWYEKGKSPEYTCVICALPLIDKTKREITEVLNKEFMNYSGQSWLNSTLPVTAKTM